jgi:DNA-binding NtrC family response regulator
MADNGITVLVVEDEMLIRMDIAESLQDEGFTVHEASNADDAIAILIANPDIRVLFTGIDMPASMDGLKLAAAVRNRWPPVKTIVTSGHRHLSDALLPVQGKFFDKPYDHARIVSAMREMVSAG